MAVLNLKLDLVEKVISEENDKFYFTFKTWTYRPPKKGAFWGTYWLDNLQIDGKEIDEVVFEKDENIINFSAKYDGEGYLQDIAVKDSKGYNEDYLIRRIDLFLDSYLHDNPLGNEKGEVTGELKTYYDYGDEDFVFELNKIVLREK